MRTKFFRTLMALLIISPATVVAMRQQAINCFICQDEIITKKIIACQCSEACHTHCFLHRLAHNNPPNPYLCPTCQTHIPVDVPSLDNKNFIDLPPVTLYTLFAQEIISLEKLGNINMLQSKRKRIHAIFDLFFGIFYSIPVCRIYGISITQIFTPAEEWFMLLCIVLAIAPTIFVKLTGTTQERSIVTTALRVAALCAGFFYMLSSSRSLITR